MKLEFSGLMYLNFNTPAHKYVNDRKIVNLSRKAILDNKPVVMSECQSGHGAGGNLIQNFYKFTLKISQKDKPAFIKISANYLISVSTAWAEEMLKGNPNLQKEYQHLEKIIRKEIVTVDGILNPIIQSWGIDGQMMH